MADGLRCAAGGWYVTYGVPTSNHEPRLQECTENSVTLKGLIPDADYTISLTPATVRMCSVPSSQRQNAVRRPLRPLRRNALHDLYFPVGDAGGGQLGLPLPDDVQDLLLSG